jgi:hypothetical protein
MRALRTPIFLNPLRFCVVDIDFTAHRLIYSLESYRENWKLLAMFNKEVDELTLYPLMDEGRGQANSLGFLLGTHNVPV